MLKPHYPSGAVPRHDDFIDHLDRAYRQQQLDDCQNQHPTSRPKTPEMVRDMRDFAGYPAKDINKQGRGHRAFDNKRWAWMRKKRGEPHLRDIYLRGKSRQHLPGLSVKTICDQLRAGGGLCN